MNFLLRLLLVLLAGMFILVARWAEQSYQKPPPRALLEASQYYPVPAASQVVAPAFITAGFMRLPQQAASPVLPGLRPQPAKQGHFLAPEPR